MCDALHIPTDPLHADCVYCGYRETLNLLSATREGFRCRNVNNCIHRMATESKGGFPLVAERNKEAILSEGK